VSNKVGDTVSSSGSSTGTSSTSSSSSTTPTGFVVITNPSGMEVTADFSETDALKLKKNQGATVTLNAESSTILNAKVVSVSSLPVSSSSSSGGSSSSAVEYEAVLRITSNTSGLRTGLSATVAVATGEADNALYLPTAAVTGTGTTRTVQLVNADGSTTTTSVTVGVEGTSGIQIVSGLTEGQKVKETTVSQSSNNGFPGGGGAGGGFGGGAAGGGGARPGGGGN
jgi:macrolide-specific efflux system membrane fusion protein